MARKPKDPFGTYRPQTEDVPVGDGIMQLRTATLSQEAQLMEAISSLDLGDLFSPIADLIGDGEERADGLNVLPQLATAGPQIWEAVRRVLGKQFIPAIRTCAVILLDTPGNRRKLLENSIISESGPGEPERGSTGEYLGCAAVRAYVSDEITLRQSTYCVKRAFEINNYVEALGNLIPLALAVPAQGEMTAGPTAD